VEACMLYLRLLIV